MFASFWRLVFGDIDIIFFTFLCKTCLPFLIFITLDSQPHLTCNTVASFALPLLGPLQPPTRCCRSHSETPHLPPNQSSIPRPVAPCSTTSILPSRRSKMPKIDLPLLTGKLDTGNVSSWLNLCTDSFEVWSAMNSDKSMKVSLQIVLVGLKMESPQAKHWWNENCDELK